MKKAKQFCVTVYDMRKYTYYVKAKSADEAREQVLSGEVEASECDSWTDEVEIEELKS